MQAQHTIVRSPKALGDALSRLRFARGITQAELADRLGIERRYIYEIETGKETRYALRLFELLRELGAQIEVVSVPSAEDQLPS